MRTFDRLRPALYLIASAVVAVASTRLHGQTAEPVNTLPPIARDLHGDRLPDGVVSRLGSERFRPGRDTVALAFSADGKLLASAHLAEQPLPAIELWDAATGERHDRLVTPTGAGVTCLAFSPHGNRLAAGDDRHTIWLWDLDTGKEPRAFKGHAAPVGAVVFAPDGKTLASVAQARTGRPWRSGSLSLGRGQWSSAWSDAGPP